MARVFNFSAGPSVLPEVVLKQAADEMLDYKGSGMSVMEMSHRSKVYDNIIKEAEKDLRDLMDIPDNYKVLFLQGGASQQFAAIPMNLMKNGVADYIITGQWAKKACEEAKKYGKVMSLHHRLTRPSAIFQIALIFRSPRMQIMCISAITIQFTELLTRSFRTQRARSL